VRRSSRGAGGPPLRPAGGARRPQQPARSLRTGSGGGAGGHDDGDRPRRGRLARAGGRGGRVSRSRGSAGGRPEPPAAAGPSSPRRSPAHVLGVRRGARRPDGRAPGWPWPARVPRSARRLRQRPAADGRAPRGGAPGRAALAGRRRRPLLRRVGADVSRRIDALALSVQALHADAHLGNVINTARGPLWNDWEDTFLGPVAWDLGCLHASAKAFGSDPAPGEAAQAGYGSPPADDVLDVFVDARRFQGTVWTMVFALRHLELRGPAAERLAWYRAQG
jgi:hypothetical protein